MSTWKDPERVERLKRLWLEKGLTAERISQLMGITRSSVLGKVSRLGLEPRRVTQYQAVPRQRHVYRPEPKSHLALPGTTSKKRVPLQEQVTAIPVDDTLIPVLQRKALADLAEQDCRWPVGDPHHVDFFFCGAEKLPGKSYCARHLARSIECPVSVASRETQAVPHVEPAGTLEHTVELVDP